MHLAKLAEHELLAYQSQAFAEEGMRRNRRMIISFPSLDPISKHIVGFKNSQILVLFLKPASILL